MAQKKVYDEAMHILAARRAQAVAEADRLRERMLRDERVRQAQQTMASSFRKLAAAIRGEGDYEQTLLAARAENLRAQRRLTELLHEAGEDADDFEPRYRCPKCSDTGYVGGRPCECLRQLLKELSVKELCGAAGMRLKSFDEMDLSFYSDEPLPERGCSAREWMTSILEDARIYARDFSRSSPSLLLFGATGTGKTHLSLAIAKEVTERGMNVAYGPVHALMHRMENEHFGRAEGDTEQTLLDCDLLILDDLGAEFSTPFSVAQLYAVINGRSLSRSPTVVSTNLTMREIASLYGEQIASRLMEYTPLELVGEDIRQRKTERKAEWE